MLGGYTVYGGGVISSKTYNLLNVAHTQVRVELDYYVIDSWDGERAQVRLNGSLVYAALFGSTANPNVCGDTFGEHGRQSVGATRAHMSNSLLLSVTSTLNQAPADESFGVDNVLAMVR